MSKTDNMPTPRSSPLYTPRDVAKEKRAYAEKFGRAQDGAYRYGDAVADINAENKDAA